MPSKNISTISALCLFAVAFLVGPCAQIDHMSLIHGDFGDARLNNYFLENIFQFIEGTSPSLIDIQFFYPFPYVLGFSDNLIGASPVYLVARALTDQPDTAFQIWYLGGYLANYLAAFYALRKLDAGPVGSAAGALIFTFALPVVGHSGHAQLQYRFGVPLASSLFILFLKQKEWRLLIASAGWLVWQFYCSIYIGFFLLMLITAMAVVYVISTFTSGGGGSFRAEIRAFLGSWEIQDKTTRAKQFLACFGLILLTGLLFYPYFQVVLLYETGRSWASIELMLPRPQSYILSDMSWLWSSQAAFFAALPMRHEHQMFVGMMPMLLAFAGLVLGGREKNGLSFTLLSASVAALVLVTLYFGGFSLWYWFSKLPLVSSIRAMTRVDLVLLFPVAYLAAVGIDGLIGLRRDAWGAIVLPLCLVGFLVFEFSAVSPPVSSKAEWRSRITSKEKAIPKNLPADAVLFFAQGNDLFVAAEIDAMWAALQRRLPTLNGYSGNTPWGYSHVFRRNCLELPYRIISYLGFSGQPNDPDAYRDLAQRIVPIGFSNCEASWLAYPPFTSSPRRYTAEEIKALQVHYLGRTKQSGRWYVKVRISNSGDIPISAASAVENPVRLSWRFLDAEGGELSQWGDFKRRLMSDIPANGSVELQLRLNGKMEKAAESLEVSIVQWHAFWAHEIGVPPLKIDWAME